MTRARRLTVEALLLGVALLAGCTSVPPNPIPPSSTVPPRDGGELTMALVLPDPDNLDPASAERPGERILAANLFDSLTALDREGRVRPAAAASWAADAEQRTWTFELRDGAAFADGSPVTAQSFVTAWQRVAKSRRAGVRALLDRVSGAQAFASGKATRISGLTAAGPTTLQVTLTEPFAEFPALVADPALAPVPAQATRDPAAFAARPTGNGPFALAEPATTGPDGGAAAPARDDPVRTLVLTRNPTGSSAHLDRVRIVAVPDEQTAWLAFQEGLAQYAPIPLDQLPAATEVYGLAAEPTAPGGVVTSPRAAVDVLGLDLATAPFNDRRARLGLALAINRAQLAARFSGARTAADALAPDGVHTTTDAPCEPCAHDPATARQLLAEAGVTSITLTVPRGPTGRTVAEQLTADLKAAGVTLKVTTADSGTLTRPRRRGATFLTIPTPTPSAASFLTAITNALTPRPDPTLLDLLAQATTAPDEATRTTAANQALDHLQSEAITIPLLEHRHHAAVAPGILALDPTPTGLLDLAAVSLTNPAANSSR